MRKLRLPSLVCTSIFLMGQSCVLPYEKKFNGVESVFIVDAQFTTDPSENFVVLKESVPWDDGFTEYRIVDKAEVFVIINDAERVKLSENTSGSYRFPEGFIGQVGNFYQLIFTTSDGSFFISEDKTLDFSHEQSLAP